MVSDLFETLLQETGEAIGISGLRPDANNSCLISLKSRVTIQLELDKKADFLILGCDLGSVPGGKYRENLFREALRHNDLIPNQQGIFAYSVKSDHLILFQKLPLQELNGKKVADALTLLVEKAAAWMEAIFHNDIPVVEQSFTSDRQAGMFGLKR